MDDLHCEAQPNEALTSLHFGDRLLYLRELRADDRARIEASLTRVSAPDLQMRFFSPLRHVPPALLDSLMNGDPTQQVAVAAVLRGGSGETRDEIVGVASAHRVTARVAEAAILVRSDLKRHGLGSLLLGNLISRCRQRGISRLIADVLQCNTGMLGLARHYGFRSASVEDEVCHLVLELPAAAG